MNEFVKEFESVFIREMKEIDDLLMTMGIRDCRVIIQKGRSLKLLCKEYVEPYRLHKDLLLLYSKIKSLAEYMEYDIVTTNMKLEITVEEKNYIHEELYNIQCRIRRIKYDYLKKDILTSLFPLIKDFQSAFKDDVIDEEKIKLLREEILKRVDELDNIYNTTVLPLECIPEVFNFIKYLINSNLVCNTREEVRVTELLDEPIEFLESWLKDKNRLSLSEIDAIADIPESLFPLDFPEYIGDEDLKFYLKFYWEIGEWKVTDFSLYKGLQKEVEKLDREIDKRVLVACVYTATWIKVCDNTSYNGYVMMVPRYDDVVRYLNTEEEKVTYHSFIFDNGDENLPEFIVFNHMPAIFADKFYEKVINTLNESHNE